MPKSCIGRRNHVSAGFIDIHTHGAADYDFLDNDEEGFLRIAQAHAEHGAGSIVPTITSADTKSTIDAILTFDKVKNKNTKGANMIGVHLEGPYFAPSQKGAQEERFLRDYSREEYEEILSATDSMRGAGMPDEPLDVIGWMRERTTYENLIKDNIDYDIMIEKFERKLTR